MTNYRLENLGCGGVLRQILQEEISDAEITAIESTIRPFIAIEITNSQDNFPLPWDSHFGGIPYLPVGMDYPQINDKPAPLLAQFNFAANCSGYTQPSSPSPFSQKRRRGTCPVQNPSPCLGEGFRVRADRVVTSNVLFYTDR